MAKIMIIGNLGEKAEVKKVSDNKEVINFHLAENQEYVDKKTGEVIKRTNWYVCSYFVSNAAKLATYMTKGSRFFVFGELTFKDYLTKDNRAAISYNVLVKDLSILETKDNATVVNG